MTDKPAITALAPWFGAKRNLAPAIIEEVGQHSVWWDLCYGSLAVTLVKPQCTMETAVDLHWDVTNLAKVVKDEKLGPALYRRLRRTLMTEQLHREAAERYAARGYSPDVPQPDLERAYDYFLCAWLGRNGVAGTGSYKQGFCVRYTPNGGHAAKRWDSAIRSIPAWRRRIANVTILTRDLFEVVPRIPDDKGTAIYCDPPYLVKGAKYLHDFAASDHERLAKLLGRFKQSRVVVSYYDHPGLARLYPGWTQRKIEVSKALAHQGRRGSNDTKAVEVLILNGPSLATPSKSPNLFD